MSEAWEPQAVIMTVMLGGVLGMLGQALRVVVGLKKVHDESGEAGKPFAEVFNSSRLILSLLVGFVAGALTLLFDEGVVKTVRMETVGLLLAAGYAGTDATEALMRRGQGNAPVPAPAAQPAGPGGENDPEPPAFG